MRLRLKRDIRLVLAVIACAFVLGLIVGAGKDADEPRQVGLEANGR
jgi:hypothetical protein